MASVQHDLAESAGSEATRHVSRYFAEVQTYLKETLDRFEEEADAATLNTFNQIEPGTNPKEDLERNLPPPETPGDLITWTLQRQNALADWCATLSDKALSGRTADLFGGIAGHLREQARQFASDTKSYAQDRNLT
jgi:hypothetical protein